ncbi:MAG TPA: acetylxylan esterase, partial [Solirubrobacterales bacterium]|nr:acetylxylan esterase [Solirubrobacterales bacterium]
MLATFIIAPSAANAAITEVFDGNGDIPCVTQGPGANEGQRWCGTGSSSAGNVSASVTFDGVPVDVNVAFPDEAEFGAEPYPLVMLFHGYGGRKFNFTDGNMQRWLDKGYAVYTQTNRGFGYTCKDNPAAAGCENGYVHLMDFRYEVRDVQIMTGRLVDDGVIQPTKIASTGGSYGGGMSMALAALKDRVMMQNGSLVPWTSPDGTPMSLAVATPNIPWTELTYALAPNGSNIDYIKDASYYGRTGVMKESYVQGLSISARNAPTGSDPTADIMGWRGLLDAGEPYDSNPATAAMITEINTFHSSYGLPPVQAPAPLLISSGFTDDLFPVNEATRYYNRTRAQYPNTPLSLFFGSFGHDRGQSQANVSTALRTLENQWVDYYLKGEGSQPASDVTTYTQTCPAGSPGEGPYTASDWASIAPGEIRLEDKGGRQNVEPNGGDPAVSSAFNPLSPGLKACAAPAGAKEPGTANYELPAAPAGGYTVMGAPTVIAKITLPGDNSQIAARLVDVAPDGNTKILVARGLWRPAQSGFQVFQLFANGWKVEEGHVLRLELLPKDAKDAPGGLLTNYGRPSNDQQQAVIDKVDLRVPVVESPGALGGLVKAPAKRVLPDRPGVELAVGNEAIGSETIADYASRVEPPCPAGTTGTTPPDCTPDPDVIGPVSVIGNPTVKGKQLTVKVRCQIGNDSCSKTSLVFKGAPKKGKKGKGLLIAKGSAVASKPGQTRSVKLNLTKAARKFFKDKKVRKNGKKKTVRGPNSLRAKVTA